MLAAGLAFLMAFQSLEVRLAVWRAAWQAPGLVVAVVRPDAQPHFLCLGVAKLGDSTSVTPDTLFPIGSCTKSFTSALAAKLADEGKFRLDTPVRDYLPEFRLADPAANARVTVRDLLSHRTGVEGHDLLWYRTPWPQTEAVARLADLEPKGEFRKSYNYSSLQYIAAGQALAAAGGDTWANLVRDRLTRPLGMTATTFVTPATDANRATGYRRGPGGKVEPMPDYRMTEPNASGSIFSTARDLARWAEFQLASGAFHGKRIVSELALGETHTPHIAMLLSDPGIAPSYPATTHADYCQGWVKFDHRGLTLLSHGGVSDGFRAQITLVPEKQFAVVVLTNLHKSMLNLAATDAVVDAYAGLPPTDWGTYFLAAEQAERAGRTASLAERDKSRGVPLPARDLGDYTGTYAERAYGRATVTESAGRLHLRWAGIDTPLVPYSGDYFRIVTGPGADELVEFAPTAAPKGMRLFGRVFRAAK